MNIRKQAGMFSFWRSDYNLGVQIYYPQVSLKSDLLFLKLSTSIRVTINKSKFVFGFELLGFGLGVAIYKE